MQLTPEQAPPVPESKPWGFRWPYVVAVCIPLLALVVFFVTRQLDVAVPLEPLANDTADSGVVNERPQEVEPAPEPDVVIIPDVGQLLTQEFVAQDDWREPNLKEFQDTWGRLPARDRIVAKGALWFAPLVDGLEYQITEATEFSTDLENDERLESLYQFALNLGLPELALSGWRPKQKKPVVRTTADVVREAPVVDAAPQPMANEEASDSLRKPAVIETENTCRASQLRTRKRSCHDLLDSGGDGPAMRVLAAGSFGDGSVVEWPFAISSSEISRREFEMYCEQAGVACPDDPWPEENMPVVNVSWNQAVAYSAWLSERTGYTYRLPTHTEWEYAARAESVFEYPFGEEISPAMARYSGLAEYDRPLTTDDTTTRRNDFGLWHVVGNVREWVAPDSVIENDERAARGGSFADSEDALRLSIWTNLTASDSDAQTGFRVLREL